MHNVYKKKISSPAKIRELQLLKDIHSEFLLHNKEAEKKYNIKDFKINEKYNIKDFKINEDYMSFIRGGIIEIYYKESIKYV